MAARDLRRIIPYVKPHWVAMTAMLIGAVGANAVAAFIPLLVKDIVDGVSAHKELGSLTTLLLAVLILGLLEAFLLGLRRFVLAKASSTMEKRLREDLYSHLQKLPLSFHGKWQSGQLLSRAVGDANLIFREFVSFAVVYFIANMCAFVVVCVLLFRLQPLLAALVLLVGFPVFIAGRKFRVSYKRASRELQDKQGDVGTFIEEAALGIRVITAYGRQKEMEKSFIDLTKNVQEMALRSVHLKGRFAAILAVIPNVLLAVVLCGGALAVSNGSMTLGGLVAFMSLVLMLVWPVESLGQILSITHEASTAAERIFEVIDIEPEVQDKPNARTVDSISGLIEFKNVTMFYGAHKSVLNGVNLCIEPGETVAIVGRTGSGKSSICGLIPRLRDVNGGAVLIDGVDVRDFRLASLRSHIGYAFEESVLFSASARDNLLLGHPKATDSEIDAALELAQARFVYDLPDGLDTLLGEQGLSLSGGQRQRLALARAVVGRPQILVLDDPLSALDVHTESLVEKSLRNVLHGTTALLCVHRSSTVALADRVAFLEDGKITAVGAHSDLMERIPAYRQVLSQEVAAR